MAYAVYGTGGFAREVAPLVVGRMPGSDSNLVFVDDSELRPAAVNGHPVIDFPTLCSSDHRHRQVVVAIGDGTTRKRVESKVAEAGFELTSVKASTAIVMDEVELGVGAVLADFVVLTSNIKVGRSFQANIYSYVAHDCVIGDYVTFAPRVNCNGNVHIGDNVYVGTGASIIQGTLAEPLMIGAGAIIGMGAVVTKPVPPNTVVAGNPARAIRTI